MLKIYINNEEVIANQNFTIQKHMLNTPSVILNNVCPKTWCDEKDYITNFYHPLDYSKCKIVDETFHPYDPGITTTINQSATLNNVDTTKLYELTQIEGNTTQSGTPTPSSPQPINVVSGRQDINVVGKNLFNPTLTINGTNVNLTNCTAVKNNDMLSFTATAKDWYFGEIRNTGQTYQERFGYLIEVEEGETYSFTISNTNITKNFITYYDENKISLGSVGKSASSFTYTIPSGAKYITLRIGIGQATIVGETYTTTIQIEEGTATTYEAYTGQSYEINLGKQLLYLKNNTYTADGITTTVEDGEITLNGTATTTTFIQVLTEKKWNLEKGIPYTVSANNEIANSNVRIRIDSNGTLDTTLSSTNASKTITYNSEILLYTRIAIRVQSGTTLTNFKFKPMIEKGNVATSYSPYKTPIELCKIGDYQDRIYKENGTWYLHKEIGKVVLNGSESWSFINSSLQSTNELPSDIQTISSNTNAYSNNFKYKYYSSGITALIQDGEFGWNSSKKITFKISSLTTKQQYLDWLSTHNTIVYYVLATPTTEEITDNELISQLNAIELLEGLNNISITSGNLPGIMTIHYNFNDAYTTEDLLFCGVVKNSGNISLNPREPHYTTLQVLDFKDFLSSGETLDFVIYQKTILEAIQQVIGTIQDYGFILGNVNILNPNEIIGAYSTKNKTAYDVFNYIADITQSRWTTRMIDENTVAIDFYDPTLMPQGTEIDYTNAYFNDKLIDDMKYSYGTNNYRNKQVMISNQVRGNLQQTQTFYSNGYETQFIVELPISNVQSITVNNVEKIVATEVEKNLGINADFYYSVNSNIIESESNYSVGAKIQINYIPIIEGRQIISNNDEIDRINESTGRKGVISRYEKRNDATTLNELRKIGESYIKYKGTPEIVLTIQSRKNTWEVGQRVQFNAPIDELDTEYMVRSKKINYIANQQENESQLFYTYELISSFNSETEINYFDNQRAKVSGNIGEGEYINRNIDIETTTNVIFYDTEATEVQVSGDNELNAILNSPFTS